MIVVKHQQSRLKMRQDEGGTEGLISTLGYEEVDGRKGQNEKVGRGGNWTEDVCPGRAGLH